MWAQRSRVLWANQGDKNSKYFHCCATKRFRNNTLKELEMRKGYGKLLKKMWVMSWYITTSHYLLQ